MNIQLINSRVEDLLLSKVNETTETDKEIEFSYGIAFSKTENNVFLIVFDLKIMIDENYFLILKYLSKFKADVELKKSDHDSKFFSINAPAIAFPFLRSYVANFALSSGYDPVMLPTINFVKLAENKAIQKQELENKPEQ